MRAIRIMNETMKRVGNRIETRLPWKEDSIAFPDSKSNALKRLKFIENKMDKNPEYTDAYCRKLNDLLERGYVRKLSQEEVSAIPNNQTWYLPHFGVVNPNKKLRIVFDAAAKSNECCLNNYLSTGPDLYNSLMGILLNFRIKRIAFVADIKEMFLQVLVRQKDRRVQRFLWRGKNRTQEPDTYKIGVVFFGSTSGPCLAQTAKNKNAEKFKDQFPEAVEAILNDYYMDDYLGAADTEDEAIKLIQEIIFVHKQGGFNICNWLSNSKEVIQKIEPALVASNFLAQKNLNVEEESVERI